MCSGVLKLFCYCVLLKLLEFIKSSPGIVKMFQCANVKDKCKMCAGSDWDTTFHWEFRDSGAPLDAGFICKMMCT